MLIQNVIWSEEASQTQIIKHTQTNPYIGKVSETTLPPLYMWPHFKLFVFSAIIKKLYLTCSFVCLSICGLFQTLNFEPRHLYSRRNQLWWHLNAGQSRFKGVSSERSSLRSQRSLSEWTYSLNNPQTGSFFRFLWPFQLDVVGLGVIGRKKVAGARGHWRVCPPASPTAQESTTGRSEESTNPAHEHGATKLRSAKKSRVALI